MEPLNLVRELTTALRALRSSTRRIRTRQLSQDPPRDAARASVDSYFRSLRPVLIDAGIPVDHLRDTDQAMQRLLSFSNRSPLVSTFLTSIDNSLACIESLENEALLVPPRPSSSGLQPIDELILRTLKDLKQSAAVSYEQAVRDLEAATRLSWRGPATDLRESLRETLDYLAPDKEVEAQTWYKQETDTHGPTMRQKTRYILQNRGQSRKDAEGTETAVAAIDELVGSFVRATYTRSNLSTHTPTDKAEVLRVRDWVRLALCEILAIRA